MHALFPHILTFKVIGRADQLPISMQRTPRARARARARPACLPAFLPEAAFSPNFALINYVPAILQLNFQLELCQAPKWAPSHLLFTLPLCVFM